ncbi:MAG: carbonic anhydrase family protein [Nitrospinae bacterium]|nr:carbonic anhydrase family protein [Nitrospinota bacterium]
MQKKVTALASSLALVLFASLSACSSSSNNTAANENGGHSGAPHWSYEGDTGPAHWGDLSTEWAACKNGQTQSPIDIANAAVGGLHDVSFNYQPTGYSVQNNGHTIMATPTAGGSISVNGKEYTLKQFHFHAPSEHTKDGVPYAAEGHLVHQAADGEYAVVGILYNDGAEDTVVAGVWANVPAVEGEDVTAEGFELNPQDLLPGGLNYWRYSGSLTTPPCTEGLIWTVLEAPMTLSTEQIAVLQEHFTANARPVQSLFDRIVTYVMQ